MNIVRSDERDNTEAPAACRGCGVELPCSGMSYCSQDCLDRKINLVMARAVDDRKNRPVFKRGNLRWCGWCGETLARGRMSFCSFNCRDSYRTDIGLSA